MKIRRLFLSVVAGLAGLKSFAQGTVIFDQYSFTGPPSADQLTAITPGQPFGQSFTPSLQAVGFINLALAGDLSGHGGDVHINVLSGSITGPVIGTSASVYVSAFSVYTFNFANTVALNPGTTYYFQPIVEAGGGNLVTPSLLNPYAGGTAYYLGNPAPNGDLEFQEGVYAPEPSTFALLAAGAGALIWARRSKHHRIDCPHD